MVHNFFSDTQTKPSRAMLETVLSADVGDEQRGEDRTTLALEARVAELLGKDAAIYMPSGTMCNEIAINIHCRPGDEIICAAQGHIVGFEGGGPAALSGAMIRLIVTETGTFGADDVQAALRSGSRYEPRSRLVSVEQTVNVAGGIVWPVEALDAVAEAARSNGLATHMDGARLMNAAVASGVPAARHAAGFDSVWIDFTKGLAAPFGAVLAGSRDFILEAWRLKQRWGGAMRQSGVMAAMCLHALDHNVDRLADDHALARSLADRLGALDGVAHVIPPQSNIVIFDLSETAPDATRVTAALADRDIHVCPFGGQRIRIVTHRDVSGDDADALIAGLAAVLG